MSNGTRRLPERDWSARIQRQTPSGRTTCFAAGVRKTSFDTTCDLEEIPRRIGKAGIVFANGRIDERDETADGGLLVGGELADGRLVAAAALGPLVGERAGREGLAGFGLHLHRLHAVEVGGVGDDRRAAGGQVGEGNIGSGINNRRDKEKQGQ